MRRRLTDYAMLFLAGILYALALKYFVLPSKVVLTGTEGIASSCSYYFENYLLFIVLYLTFHSCLLTFAFARVSRTFAFRSSFVVVIVATCLALLPDLQIARPEPENERIILVIFGGLLSGVAKALAFQRRGSTGDEDILAAFFAMKYLKPVGSIAVFAAIISTAFGLILDFFKTGQITSPINTLMYTSIYIFASSETLNNFYRRFKLTMVVVVTGFPDAIGKAILEVTKHRTHTAEQVHGGHSRQAFTAIRTVITHEELPTVLDAVRKADANAFYYFHNIDGVSQRYFIPPIG